MSGCGGGGGSSMLSGSVKSWNDEKGFGFIVPDAGGDDVFVHRTALNDGMTLVQGSQVQYETTWNAQKNKNQASKVLGATGERKGGGKGGGGGDWGGKGGGGDW